MLYQFVHALGLFVVAWLSTISADTKISLAGFLMLAGIIIFSGSLYSLSLSGIKWGPDTYRRLVFFGCLDLFGFGKIVLEGRISKMIHLGGSGTFLSHYLNIEVLWKETGMVSLQTRMTLLVVAMFAIIYAVIVLIGTSMGIYDFYFYSL